MKTIRFFLKRITNWYCQNGAKSYDWTPTGANNINYVEK